MQLNISGQKLTFDGPGYIIKMGNRTITSADDTIWLCWHIHLLWQYKKNSWNSMIINESKNESSYKNRLTPMKGSFKWLVYSQSEYSGFTMK